MKFKKYIDIPTLVKYKKRGFLTGSYKFGSRKIAKDRDYCILTKNQQDDFHDLINCGGIYNQDYNEFNTFTSIYVSTGKGTPYNFLLMEEKEFKKWKFATKLLVKLLTIPEIQKAVYEDKGQRIKWFKQCKLTYNKDNC